MGVRPSGKTLDRIDSNGSYEPGNVRWSTPREQQNNRRGVLMITIGNETRALTDWCRIHGVNRWTAWSRIFECGWPPALAVTTAANKANRVPDLMHVEKESA